MPKMMERIKKMPNKIQWDTVKYKVLFCLFVFCTLLGYILDLTYQKIFNCKCFISLLVCVKESLRFFGLSHADLWGFITSNVGVLIALVGMFFTFTIDIYERSEKKIFGVPRKELTGKKHDGTYRCLSRMATISPLLMLIYVVLGFCASSYSLLFWSYIFLLILYGRHRSSYEEEKMWESLCNKLMESAQKGMDKEGGKTCREYKNYLINIYNSAREENNWVNTEELYFKLLDLIRALDDEICFVMEYYFFVVVFDAGNKTQGIHFFTVVERYMEGISYNGELGYVDRKDVVLLWGMLAASVPYAEEKELIYFLEEFSDFGKRSQDSIRDTKKEISDMVIQEQCAMVLILLEGWMELHDIKKRELIVLAKKIYERGEGAFANGDLCGLDHMVLLYETIGNGILDVQGILGRFVKEKRMKIKISLVANLAELI